MASFRDQGSRLYFHFIILAHGFHLGIASQSNTAARAPAIIFAFQAGSRRKGGGLKIKLPATVCLLSPSQQLPLTHYWLKFNQMATRKCKEG